eukprot:2071743-Amphidinium_carterae.2
MPAVHSGAEKHQHKSWGTGGDQLQAVQNDCGQPSRCRGVQEERVSTSHALSFRNSASKT